MDQTSAMQENSFIKQIPSTKDVLTSLLKADFTVLWRQRRAFIMSIILPVIFIISWKSLIPVIGAAGVLSICIAVGLPAVGLMGYSMQIARDRERGVFQRLRTAPIPTWTIMMSRIAAQLAIILLMTIAAVLVGYYADHITVGFGNFFLLLVAALIGGMSFLAIGQTIVALIKSSEAVSSAARLIYFPLGVVGAIGEIGIFGNIVKEITTWSPLGTTQAILAATMDPTHMTLAVLWAFLATIGYGVVFATIGIRGFKWSVN